jgi:SGNH hydrolase-like domain, acetyltransferase AlgX
MRKTLFVLLWTVVLVEVFSFLASRTNLLPIHDTPEAYWSHPASVGTDWRTQKDSWGVWHKPNVTDRHTSSCFDVVYRTNSFGARDAEFSRSKADARSRYILLGDSFAEGLGVDIEHTTQHYLEQLLGIDVYNFGVAGFVGPLNAYVLYRDLASTFEHDGVIVYFLPANDFTDSDYELWKEVAPTWLRPYYRKRPGGDFEIFYPDTAKPSDEFVIRTPAPTSLFGLLRKYTWTSNTLRSIKLLVEERLLRRNPLVVQDASYSGYFSATPEQQEAAVYFIEKLVQAAAQRKVIVLIIPDQADMKRIRSGEGYATQPWYQGLSAVGQRHSNVDIIDLAEHMPADYNKDFLTCDHHWSEAGHRLAAQVLAERLISPNGRLTGRPR